MEKILTQLEKKVERVASAISRLKEENASLTTSNKELNERLRELERHGSSGDGAVKGLRSRISKLEQERKTLIELRKRVETRLEAVLSQFDWLEK
ncbi:MAG: cell division protein ZapB [Candidatus Eiseniibacteriota bacterium]|nr:MAG: cell division protein ZapB [Candidatus Eisenbacteria bacterium]